LNQTQGIGNRADSLKQVNLSSPTAVVTFVGVRWDGDKVRGIRMQLSDGTSAQAGGYDDGRYTLTTFQFGAGEKLTKAWLRDSGYGHGSLRQIHFATSHGRSFSAGANGYDSEADLIVDGTSLVGFHAWVNPDNFINGLALMVRQDGQSQVVQRQFFQTKTIGNAGAGHKQVQSMSIMSVCGSFQARWDGDKIRGIRMVLRDGTTTSAGGIDDVHYTLTSYTFAEDETLVNLSLSSSGYGNGSLRRIEFTTNKGGHFAAGPQGIDDLITPPVAGARLVGFHAWVNVDNFINALAFEVTDDAPYTVKVYNHSPWPATYANGVVTVNHVPAIHIANTTKNLTATMKLQHNRVLAITSGDKTGYCAFDGAAQLQISIFADATYEAKFGVDYGDGTVYGPIQGVAPSGNKLELMGALVRKYAPIFMLNVDEVYWPSNVDAFMTHMILQKVLPPPLGPQDFYTGPLNRQTLAQQAALLGGNNFTDGACLRTAADLNHASDTQDWFNGTRPVDGSQITSYAVVTEGKNGKLNIVYWWFFNYNQGKTVASTSWGNHVSDWEHVRVELQGVDFSKPQHDSVLDIVYDHHGDKETHPPGDGVAEFSGLQVLVHIANGSHEAYPKAGVYSLKFGGTHDYCKDNAYRYDSRLGSIEVYQWNDNGFQGLAAGAPADFKDPAWLLYKGRWGNWQRGQISAFGYSVSELESGPEGLNRAGEYPIPG
jgi:hypothetical protein